MTKTCTKCNTEYPATTEFFNKQSATKDGLKYWCKRCIAVYCKICRQSDKHKCYQKEYHKLYRATIAGHLRQVYYDMKRRCNDLRMHNYYRYGGRGIRCEFKSPNEFIDYIVNDLRIDPRGLQIDRIDNDGHYEKGNVRFVTVKENRHNRG